MHLSNALQRTQLATGPLFIQGSVDELDGFLQTTRCICGPDLPVATQRPSADAGYIREWARTPRELLKGWTCDDVRQKGQCCYVLIGIERSIGRWHIQDWIRLRHGDAGLVMAASGGSIEVSWLLRFGNPSMDMETAAVANAG